MTTREFDLGGVIVATTLAFKADASAPAGLAVDYDKFATHCDWLISNGCRGVGPNGSLGEYSSLTDEERRTVIQVAVKAVDGRGLVVAGVHERRFGPISAHMALTIPNIEVVEVSAGHVVNSEAWRSFNVFVTAFLRRHQ